MAASSRPEVNFQALSSRFCKTVRISVGSASDESLLPTSLDTCCRAGCTTPVASCTPMDPARGLVGSRRAGEPPDADDSP